MTQTAWPPPFTEQFNCVVCEPRNANKRAHNVALVNCSYLDAPEASPPPPPLFPPVHFQLLVRTNKHRIWCTSREPSGKCFRLRVYLASSRVNERHHDRGSIDETRRPAQLPERRLTNRFHPLLLSPTFSSSAWDRRFVAKHDFSIEILVFRET